MLYARRLRSLGVQMPWSSSRTVMQGVCKLGPCQAGISLHGVLCVQHSCAASGFLGLQLKMLMLHSHCLVVARLVRMLVVQPAGLSSSVTM
jgi:hypothetical protein